MSLKRFFCVLSVRVRVCVCVCVRTFAGKAHAHHGDTHIISGELPTGRPSKHVSAFSPSSGTIQRDRYVLPSLLVVTFIHCQYHTQARTRYE
jgi:hypothetical protein